ncbi:MAG: hypothetical protein RIT04_20 [Candidatus Parcubacteria bacterium]|jgi:hypothetical protein
MEDLTKQQIVLVTLLVSFVTSIATGIVTVTLVDQLPRGVTQTINNVVEHTIERVVSNQSGQTASVSDGTGISSNSESLADAIDKSSKSLVRIKHIGNSATDASTITGFGVVVSKDGVIVTDKSTVSVFGSYVALFSDGTELPIDLFQSQNNGDIAFLIAHQKGTSTKTFQPVSFATSSLKLGAPVFAIGGSATLSLAQGFISNTDMSTSISTSLSPKAVMIGSPLINAAGAFIGIRTASLDGVAETAVFYPLSLIKSAIPKEGTVK